MYPAQTSLIPTQVALARFLEQGGFSAIFSNYPYWYLGTTPFRYLTGPIVPTFLALLHRLLPNLSLFELIFGLVGVSWIIGAVGVYLLLKELGREKITALLATLFYLFGPIAPFLFRFGDGLYLMSLSFLPFVLLIYSKTLRNWTQKSVVVLIISICFLILLDSLILTSLVLGMAAIFLAQVGWKETGIQLKRSLLLVTCALLLATLWYTPGYWLTLLGAPSFGGKGLAQVIVWLGKLLPLGLAFGLAIFSARLFKKRDLLRDFCFYWLFIFGFLTLLRFLSDPDFWLDWSAYGIELQLGIAISLGLIATQRFKKLAFGFVLLAFEFLLFAFVFNKYVLGTLQTDIKNTVEYRISKQLEEIANPGEKVFLSGTTAFWLNAFVDIPQVRGGVDQTSVDPSWREAVWKIREGTDEAEEVLKELKVSYLVVHGPDSEEYYHDFVNPERFKESAGLEKIYEEKGDVIYVVKQGMMERVAP